MKNFVRKHMNIINFVFLPQMGMITRPVFPLALLVFLQTSSRLTPGANNLPNSEFLVRFIVQSAFSPVEKALNPTKIIRNHSAPEG